MSIVNCGDLFEILKRIVCDWSTERLNKFNNDQMEHTQINLVINTFILTLE